MGKIWINGEIFYKKAPSDIIPYSLSAFHYGTGIFDGILCVKNNRSKNECFIFRLKDHINRIYYSAGIIGLKIPYSKEEFAKIVIDFVKSNGVGTYYIRPLIFSDRSYTEVYRKDREGGANVVILCKKFKFWKFIIQMRRERKVMISRRIRSIWPKELALAKISGKYLNYLMALDEAKEKKFEDAIILDEEGNVSEASTSNVFVVKKNIIKTPLSKSLFPGITMASVIEIANRLGYQVKKEKISIKDLFKADEIFLTNTAKGIISVKQVGDKSKLNQNKIAKLIRNRYINIIRGRDLEYSNWITIVTV